MPALVLFLIGLVARLINFAAVFPGNGRVYLFDPDCYMRLRKVMVYLAAFPKPLVYDYFQGYPQGTGIISAPLMEFLLAAVLFPFTGRQIDEQQLATLMAFIPPVIGGLTVALLYLLVREWFGATAGTIAALFLALLPVHIEATLLGRFDNEMTEPLMLVLIILVYLRTYRTESVRNWLVFGCWQTLFVILWRGALAPLAVFGLDVMVRAGRTKGWARFNRQAAAGYLLPAALFGLICLTDLWGTRTTFNYNIISWFHVVLFAVAALLVSAAGNLSADKQGVRVVTGVIMAAVCLALLPVMKPGLLVAAGGDIWIDTINQYLPAYKDSATISAFGLFPLIAPVIVWFALSGDERSQAPRRFLLGSIFCFYVMMLLRRRFGHFYAVEAAIAAGLVPLMMEKVLPGRLRLSPRMVLVLSLALMAALQLVTVSFYPVLSRNSTGPIKGDLEEAFLWLRNRTPSAGDPVHPEKLPAYSVLANWDLGGYLETIGQRPSVATSYGRETYGLEEAGRLFLALNSADVVAVMDRNRAKYLLLYDPIDKLMMYMKLLKVENRYLVDQWDAARKRFAYTPTAAALDLAVVRLYIADGSLVSIGTMGFQPIEGVRLAYESPSLADLGGFPREIHRVKIFERVQGARVVVPALSGCTVIAEQRVMTNQGREFVYRSTGEPAGSGTVAVSIPYSPVGTDVSTGAVGPLTISCGRRSITSELPADAVTAGKTLHLAW